MNLLWDADEHTIAKHNILKKYLGGWLGKLGNSYSSICYVDGFAGPGEYKNKVWGSPIIFLNMAEGMKQNNKIKANIVAVFNEIEKDRAEHLKRLIEPRKQNLEKLGITYTIINDDFKNLSGQMHNIGLENMPILYFIDPFGLKLEMATLKNLFHHPQTELLITLMTGFLNGFLNGSHLDETVAKLFGDKSYTRAKDVVQLAQIFAENLVNGFKPAYYLTFEMFNNNNNDLYHLIFVTKHPEGMRVMKEAMWQVDPAGEFKFYDKYARITRLDKFQEQDAWILNAAQMVYNEFKGKTVTIGDVEDFVVLRTPYRYRKGILKYLEKNGKIKFNGNRARNYTYPNIKDSIKFL